MGKQPFKIAIAGLGVVGTCVVRDILENRSFYARQCGRDIDIVAVCARDKTKDRGLILPEYIQWYDDPVAMVRDSGADCVIELMGGTGANVAQTIQTALDQSLYVVTANKAFLAQNVSLLHHPHLRFEAAVAGGIPVIETIRTSLRANRIIRITAILNGTCNYILHKLAQEPQNFEDVIRQAQIAGYAEADPTLDISGTDAMQKAVILSHLAFGDAPDTRNIICEGLDKNTPDKVQAACAENEVIRMVAEIERKQSDITISVVQKRFKRTDDFANVIDAQNAIFIESDPVNTLFLKGYGAGGKPTASAVLADICAYALR